MNTTVQPIRSKRDRAKMKAALHGRNRLLFVMGISLGLRITDLLQLKIGDVRGKDRLHIKEKKTGKSKTIYFSPSLKRELAKLEGPDDEYVFKSRKGKNKPISRQMAYIILNEAAERAGIKDKIGKIGCHSLRKTHGWILYEEQGVDITRIMTMLNHSTPQHTLRYIGVTESEIKEAYEAIEV